MIDEDIQIDSYGESLIAGRDAAVKTLANTDSKLTHPN